MGGCNHLGLLDTFYVWQGFFLYPHGDNGRTELNLEIYKKLEVLISTTFLLLFAFFLFWAGIVIVMQGVGWIKFATWQPVPFGALFVSASGHEWISFYQDKFQALNLVPAMGSVREIEMVAVGLAGNLIGLQKIFAFILDTSLVLWLCIASGVCLTIANNADLSP